MAGARLRSLLAQKNRILVYPGVYDGLIARIALRGGFECLYMPPPLSPDRSRDIRLAARLPDLGIVTLPDMLSNASMIASLDGTVPLIADADTGYGGPIMVAQTVKSYISAGVAGLHLENQVLSKRCGHLLGKEVVATEVFLSRIRAAVLAREEAAGDVVLIARTDALQALGFQESVERLRLALEIGADVAFLEGVRSVEEGDGCVSCWLLGRCC